VFFAASPAGAYNTSLVSCPLRCLAFPGYGARLGFPPRDGAEDRYKCGRLPEQRFV